MTDLLVDVSLLKSFVPFSFAGLEAAAFCQLERMIPSFLMGSVRCWNILPVKDVTLIH